jgi:hypothetical protein
MGLFIYNVESKLHLELQKSLILIQHNMALKIAIFLFLWYFLNSLNYKYPQYAAAKLSIDWKAHF